MKEVITCYGHENVRATHRSTLEFTKDEYLTPRGDCILCIRADKGLKDLDEKFKKALKGGKKLLVRIRVNGYVDEVVAYGDKRLTFESENSIIIRKSTYIDDRTLAIKASKAAGDIDRKIVEKLKNPEQKAIIELIILDESHTHL
ncbi:DUF371 domain-containing protein [Thermococcus sp.]